MLWLFVLIFVVCITGVAQTNTPNFRRQQFLNAFAAVTPPNSDLKVEFPYQIARMLLNATNTTTFTNARNRALVLLQNNNSINTPSSFDDPFRIHAAMHGFFVASNLYTAQMIAETKRVAQLPAYDTTVNYVSENFYLMYNGSGFLGCEQWPDIVDAGGQTAAVLQPAFKAQLLKYFDRFVKTNMWEHGSPVYVATDLSPLRMLAEYARDAEVRRKARGTLDWLMLNLACDWNQGYYATAAARCKGWTSVNSSPDDFGTTPGVGWMYYGGVRAISSFTSGVGEINHVFWLAYLRDYTTPPIFQKIAAQRTDSFSHRSAAWMNNATDTDFKSTWHTTNYSLASDYTLSGNPASAFAKERQPVVLKWLSDKPESTLILGMENHALFYSPYLNFTTYVPAKNIMGYGMNPYSQHFQIRQTIVGVCNVSPYYANQNGNETNAAVIAGLDPLFFAEFYVPLTKLGAIKLTVETNGWVFCHGGTTLFGIRTAAPYSWGADLNNCRMLRSKALKNAWVLETASVDQFPGANITNQLAAFRSNVLANAVFTTNNVNAALPRVQYTSIHGYTLDLTWRPHQTDNYWTVPPRFPAAKDWNTATDYIYTTQAKSNGVAINYTRAAWPLLENPWMNQDIGETNLDISINGFAANFRFPNNSTNWGLPPVQSELTNALTIFSGQSIALPFTVTDGDAPVAQVTNTAAAANTNLLPAAAFVVTGSGTNRTLTLTPPPGAVGATTFTLAATDAQGASVAQTVAVNILPLPTLDSGGVVNGQFQFLVNGPTGFKYTIQASTNLVTWTNLITATLPVLPWLWADAGATNFPSRFYRVQADP